MSGGPVRIFLLERHVALNHAGKLTASPGTDFDRVDRT